MTLSIELIDTFYLEAFSNQLLYLHFFFVFFFFVTSQSDDLCLIKLNKKINKKEKHFILDKPKAELKSHTQSSNGVIEKRHTFFDESLAF